MKNNQLNINENFFIKDINSMNLNINPNIFIKKKILIAGASGLIGTYFCAFFISLIQKNFNLEVYALTKKALPQHLSLFKNIKNFKHIKMDLTKVDDYKKLPIFDYIIHSAGYAQPSIFMNKPEDTIAVNVLGTSELLKKLKKNGSLLFLSSYQIYFGTLKKKYIENDCGFSSPSHERACYIEGKRCAEALCHAYRRKGYNISVARLGDIYGPGTKPGDKRAINSFIEQAIKSKKIILRDKGNAKRSYCYILDAINVLLKMLINSKETIYNVGSPYFLSIKDVSELICSITNSKLIIPKNVNSIIGAPKSLDLDLNKIKKEFGSKKFIDINEGLKRTILWQKENIYN